MAKALASTELAAEKGAFPLFERDAYLAGPSIQALDADVRAAITERGIRNALITSIAPTGTISLLADNVSSGLEPVFSFTYTRHILMPDGTRKDEEVSDYAYRLYKRLFGETAELFESARRAVATLAPPLALSRTSVSSVATRLRSSCSRKSSSARLARGSGTPSACSTRSVSLRLE